MIGVEGAASLLAAALGARVPARLTGIEIRLGLPAGSLTPPQLVLPREEWHLRLEDYPALLVVAQEVRAMDRLDLLPEGGEVFRVRYAMRAFVWARGEHAADTDLARKRLTLAVREALLWPGGLGPAGTAAAVDPVSLIESYSDIDVDDEIKATIAASYVGCDVLLEETVAGPPPTGIAETVAVSVAATIHPALLEEEL